MNTFLFNNDFFEKTNSNKDVLSVFKQTEDKKLTIENGMSVKEISEIVSDKIISVVKEQFQSTKEQFESNK